MWKPWDWARMSNHVAQSNARAASTELSRRRVQREEADRFLAEQIARVTKSASA